MKLKRTILLTTFLFLSGSLFALPKTVVTNASVGSYPNATVDQYYYSLSGTSSGTTLLGQLHDLITTTHKTYTEYDDSGKNNYQKYTDAYIDENGNVSIDDIVDFYSQSKWPNTWDSNAGNEGGYNREHVWCQSRSNNLWGKIGGGADMHHIRPLETRLNSTRNNAKFGYVEHLTANEAYAILGDKSNPTKKELGGWCLKQETFEPIDNSKGDVARILMYLYVHYNTYSNVSGTTNGSGLSSYFGTLNFTHIVAKNSEQEAQKMLIDWNKVDTVSKFEKHRNNQVAIYQGNRNPFIDYPDLASAIWDGKTWNWNTKSLVSSGTDYVSLDKTNLNLKIGESSTIAASSNGGVTWTNSNSSALSMTVSGNSVTIKGLSEGNATITASYNGKSASCSVTILPDGGTITPVTEAKTITINHNDEFSPSLPKGNNPSITSEQLALKTYSVHNVNLNMVNVYLHNSGYLMAKFVTGQNTMIYNDESLGEITNVSITYSGTVGISGRVHINFSDSKMDSAVISSNPLTPIKNGGTSSVDNATANQGYFQIYITNKNVQIKSISISIKVISSNDNLLKGTFYKVNEEQTDWSGNYLIAYQNENNILPFSGGGSQKQFSLIDGVKVKTLEDAALCSFVISKKGEGYSIRLNGGTNNGYYLYADGSSDVSYSPSQKVNNINYNTTSNGVDIKFGSYYLGFDSGTNTFKYSTSGTLQRICLLKQYVKSDFINDFMNKTGVVCALSNNGQINVGSQLEPVWSELIVLFNELNASDKLELINGDGTTSLFERYDYLLNKYSEHSLTNFLERNLTNSANKINQNKTTIHVLSLVGITSILSLVFFFIIIKKKQVE